MKFKHNSSKIMKKLVKRSWKVHILLSYVEILLSKGQTSETTLSLCLYLSVSVSFSLSLSHVYTYTRVLQGELIPSPDLHINVLINVLTHGSLECDSYVTSGKSWTLMYFLKLMNDNGEITV